MSEPYLKPRRHYEERYDRRTVEECRRAEKTDFSEPLKDMPEGTTLEQAKRYEKGGIKLYLYFHTGERYRKRAETIDKWMRKDEEHDRYLANAQTPRNIFCLACGREMFVSHKHLETDLEKPDRVLFFYDCTLDHIPRRAFYDNGEEWKCEKPLCPKCRTPFEEEDRTDDKKFVTISTCPGCGHSQTSEIERTATKKAKPDPDFEKDRTRFCLSDEEGMKYVNWMQTLHDLSAVLEKEKQKEKEKDVYDLVSKIKRLKIIELDQLLASALERQGYVKLNFKDPEITKDVVVPFTVHDGKEGREDRVSSLDLQSLIRKTLMETNWRLMTEGIHYRLGMLEGRLKAYEKEEDLADLVRKQLKREIKTTSGSIHETLPILQTRTPALGPYRQRLHPLLLSSLQTHCHKSQAQRCARTAPSLRTGLVARR